MKVLTSWWLFTRHSYPLLVRLSVGLKAVYLLLHLLRYFSIFSRPRHGKFNYHSDEADVKVLSEVAIILK